MFTVAPAVLIPRPETEFLVETALRRLQAIESPRVLDIGLGSGAVLISLLSRLPQAIGVGTDISEPALAVARGNAAQLLPGREFQARQDDLFPKEPEMFHAIVSNPPYIRRFDLPEMSPEVRTEPVSALDGGEDGLDFYRRIVAGAAQYLLPEGFLALEIGAGQAVAVTGLAVAAGWALEETVPDYAGIDRVLVFVRTGEAADR